jgi:hypothetical protein
LKDVQPGNLWKDFDEQCFVYCFHPMLRYLFDSLPFSKGHARILNVFTELCCESAFSQKITLKSLKVWDLVYTICLGILVEPYGTGYDMYGTYVRGLGKHFCPTEQIIMVSRFLCSDSSIYIFSYQLASIRQF